VSTTISIPGSGNVDVNVLPRHGDRRKRTTRSLLEVQADHRRQRNDTLTLGAGGVIYEHGASGHDTINIGSGNATIYSQGYATITAPSAPPRSPAAADLKSIRRAALRRPRLEAPVNRTAQ